MGLTALVYLGLGAVLVLLGRKLYCLGVRDGFHQCQLDNVKAVGESYDVGYRHALLDVISHKGHERKIRIGVDRHQAQVKAARERTQ